MSFPKPKRIKDPDLLKAYRDKPCAVNNRYCRGPVAGHHIRSRGSGGDDVDSNIQAYCLYHHREIHAIGPTKFLAKYPDSVKKYCK